MKFEAKDIKLGLLDEHREVNERRAFPHEIELAAKEMMGEDIKLEMPSITWAVDLSDNPESWRWFLYVFQLNWLSRVYQALRGLWGKN